MFAYHGYESLIDPHLNKADHCCPLLSRAMAPCYSSLKNTGTVFLDLELTYISIFLWLSAHPALKKC